MYLLTIEAEAEKYKIKRIRKIIRKNLKVVVQPGILLSESCSWLWEKKRVKARRGGLVLGELKISIISTFIEYIGKVSKAVYE